jgi:ubiquinone/menaquinone biosynthesis C-methylase UbiE
MAETASAMTFDVRKNLMSLSCWFQRKLTPGLRYSQDVFEEFLFRYVPRSTAWLEVGCGHEILSDWRFDAERRLLDSASAVVGVDYDYDSLRKHRSLRDRCRADLSQLPFPAESFDLVTANMVVEHLTDPVRQFSEIQRVLRPGGFFVFHTPNALAYTMLAARMLPNGVKPALVRFFEGRPESDTFPAYYRANRPKQIARVATAAGLRVVELHKVVTSPLFHMIPPLLVPELLWIRILMKPRFRELRQDLIGVLRKGE